jgi:hypothetical protein
MVAYLGAGQVKSGGGRRDFGTAISGLLRPVSSMVGQGFKMNAVRVIARKAIQCLPIFGLTACFASGVLSTSATAKDQKTITAEYNISFNGLSIGDFVLRSDLNGDEYNLKGRARISVLAGLLFEWRGDTASSGRVSASRPRPYSYSFGYRTSDKRESIGVEFSNNNVKEIAVNPPQKKSAARIPVTSKHLRNVVDPLSAVVTLTNIGSRKSGKEVCTRRLPIFDGKVRYDLRLTYKKTKSVSTGHGYRGPAFICKVKFLPIAGHKRGDDESDYAAKNEGIEIWMIPLHEADLFVPYYVYIPTPVGSAAMTSTAFRVERSGTSHGASLN